MNTPCSIDRPPLRIGLFGIGLDVYWPQFAGLKERLETMDYRDDVVLMGHDGPGHIAGKIEKLGLLLQMETVKVC